MPAPGSRPSIRSPWRPRSRRCTDCHGTHGILPSSDPRSKVSKTQVATTCGLCHDKVLAQYRESIHGTAVARGVSGSPTCVDCHGEHTILGPRDPNSPVYGSNVSLMTCSRCHEDQRLNKRLGLPAGRLASYQSSYHGLAARSGSRTVANCASCHGVHNIFPSTDARSTVAKANLSKTCGHCHPHAGPALAASSIHVLPNTTGESRWIYYVRLFYMLVIPATLAFMLFHNFLDWFRKFLKHLAQYGSLVCHQRLSVQERIQHVLLLTSFIVLVVTGFALTYPDAFWARPIVAWEAAYPLRGVAHRVAAGVMVLAAIYHLLYVVFFRGGRRWVYDMWPRLRDGWDLLYTMAYYVGLKSQPPMFAKFNYAEKMEYWSMVWGTVVMVVTGALLWAHDLVLQYTSTLVTDLATVIHFYEAVLATAAIVVWHFYAVIFDPEIYPVKWTFVNGRAPLHEVRTGTGVASPVAPTPVEAAPADPRPPR
ncbi:MAG: cytochrome b/b6 domain-containing protein [Candidatus Riflebacteria bacterium]|nr:cytochrome b/b6 domain-containing protein [Candidatus Riflebacteria bacterium]